MLERLSPELLLLIQQSLDALVDLHALIAASPSCLRTFGSYRQHVLPVVLKNAICPVALSSALAVLQLHALDLHLPHRRRRRPTQVFGLPSSLSTLLDNYFSGIVSPFPEEDDHTGFTRLRTLYVRAMRFAEDYATRALRMLSAGDVGDVDAVAGNKVTSRGRAALHLSPGERGRLLRAFFRFELYCNVFSPRITSLDAAAQRDIFLLKLRPFEVEELACVHYYLSTLVGGLVDRLEDQFVEEALTAAKANVNLATFDSLGPECRHRRRSASPLLAVGHTSVDTDEPKHRSAGSGFSRDEGSSLYQEQHPPSSPSLNAENVPYDSKTDQAGGYVLPPWAGLDNLELCDLELFSSIDKEHYPRHISFIVSLGIDFIHALVNADSDQRRSMILNNSPGLRPLLPEAIHSIPFPDLDSNTGSSIQQAEWGNQNRKGDMVDGGDGDGGHGGDDDHPCNPNYSQAGLTTIIVAGSARPPFERGPGYFGIKSG